MCSARRQGQHPPPVVPVLRNDVCLLHDAPPLATPWIPVLYKSRLSPAAISSAFTEFRDSRPSTGTPDGVAAYEPKDLDFYDGRGGARVPKEDARVVTLPATSCCNGEKSEVVQTGHSHIPQLVSVASLSLYHCALLISIAWINHSPGTCSLLLDSGAWMEAAMWSCRRGSKS
ncbi:hypothetical protein ACQ4PT_049822 [Festuca glaucescens]